MTKTPPHFSIITVSFNNGDGLQETGDSIQQQTFQEYEWIVIDGGSNDHSVDYLKETSALWLSEPDAGIYDAMNKGIDQAKGKYIIFMNAGDLLHDKNTLSIIAQSNADFIYALSLIHI